MNGHQHSAAETIDLAQARADRLGETIRLAFAIADDHARADIEVHCAYVPMGPYHWWATNNVYTEEPELLADIQTALRYLQLRGLVVLHPVQGHLVRFPAVAAPA